MITPVTAWLSFVPHLLITAGLIVALVLTILRRRRLGRAAPLAAVGIGVLLAQSLFDAVAPLLGYGWFLRDEPVLKDYMFTIGVTGFFSAVLWATGLGLIIAAVFAGTGVAPDSRTGGP